MRVVVVGAAGLLGGATVQAWRSAGHDVTALTRQHCDLTQPDQVALAIRPLAPQLLINCSAYNNVDLAEDEPCNALAVNAWAVRALASAAGAAGAICVHYSTDFVFDGTTDRPYTEDDQPNPQSAYGVSKLVGEWMAAEVHAHYILRVESLFGGSARRSTIDRMLDHFASGRPVVAFEDRTVSPSFVEDVTVATQALVSRQAPFGLYHCVNSGMATWLQVAECLREWCGVADARVTPVRAADVRLKARRPQFAAMSNRKLTGLDIPMPDWPDALQRHVAAWRQRSMP